METSEQRLSNPRWNTVPLLKYEENIWNTNWILTNNDTNCRSKIGGGFSENEWNNNPERGLKCFNVFNVPEHTDACMKTIVNPFSLCQIKEFEDLCRAVNTYRNDIIQINAWANNYVNIYKNLYVPSQYIKEDAIYAWNAVIETYSNIGLNVNECFDVASFVDKSTLLTIPSNIFECPSQVLFQISELVSGMRDIFMKLVDIIGIITQMCVDLVLLIVAIFMGENDTISTQGSKLITSFMQLILKLARLWEEVMKLVLSFLQNTFFNEILLLIEAICDFSKLIVSSILGFIASILDVFGSIARFFGINRGGIMNARNDILRLARTVEDWTCSVSPEMSEFTGEGFQALAPSTCWIQQSFFSMPSDILGGLVGDFTCGATSMCLPDLTDTQNKAIVCMRCDDHKDISSLGGYGCDLATKQCVCGIKIMKTSSCIRNSDCWESGAVCSTYSTINSFSFGTQPCLESVGSSYCKKESPNTGVGMCVTY